VLRAVGAARDESPEKVAADTTRTARRFFGISPGT